MGAVKIGVSLIAWQNDDLPDLTAAYTMEQALADSQKIGYSGVERGQRMPSDPDELRRYLQAYDLSLCGGWCAGNSLIHDFETETQAVRQQVEQFVALEAPCIVYAECSNTIQSTRSAPLSTRPVLSRDELRAYGKKLSALAKWVNDQGMRVAYHHHMGTIIQSEDDLNDLMDSTGPEVGLCLDTGHLLFAGGDILRVLDRWGDRVCHVHYKDVRPDIVKKMQARDSSFLDAVIAGAFSVPGDGCIDFAPITKRLKEMDYHGWIVVEAEQDPAYAPPYEYSKIGYECIHNLCTQTGITIL